MEHDGNNILSSWGERTSPFLGRLHQAKASGSHSFGLNMSKRDYAGIAIKLEITAKHNGSHVIYLTQVVLAHTPRTLSPVSHPKFRKFDILDSVENLRWS